MTQNLLIKMENNYEFGKDFEMDELRTSFNISKATKGKVRRRKKIMNRKEKYPFWTTP